MSTTWIMSAEEQEFNLRILREAREQARRKEQRIEAKIRAEKEVERQRREEQRRRDERKKTLLRTNDTVVKEATSLINTIHDEKEKTRLMSEMSAISTRVKSEIEREKDVSPDVAFNEIRQKVISAQFDEKMLCILTDEFKKIEAALSGKMLPGYLPEWNEMKQELDKIGSLTIENKLKSLTPLINRTRIFAQTVATATGISLSCLVEEKYTIASRQAAMTKKDDEKLSSMLSDIIDFSSRIAFFDENEASKLRPLIDEATTGKAGEFRLSAIRQEIKVKYGKLKEQKILTEMFKQELRDSLLLMKQARNAEAIILRIEDLLTAADVSREDFALLYEEAKVVLSEQLDRIIDENISKKVGSVLDEMGYSLVEDEKTLSAEDVNFIDSPYDGYQVKVKVHKGGTLATRLVRIVGSEDEKKSVSEYQRQKDIEVGHKWCKDLEKFHEKMKLDGIIFETTLRKAPEELSLEIVVDEKKAPHRMTHAKRNECQVSQMSIREKVDS